MNKIFKVIWSKSKQCYIVVSEVAKNHSGKKKIVVVSILAAMAVGADMSVSVNAGGLDGGYAASAGSIAIGSNSYSKGTQVDGQHGSIDPSIAIGVRSVAIGNSSLAIGLDTDIRNSYAVAVGRYSKVTGDYGIGIGYNTRSSLHGIAMGEQARSMKEGATTLGVSSRGYGNGAIAIGWQSLAGADVYTVGVPGNDINNDSSSKIDGYNSWGDMSVGLRAMATGGNATALGRNAAATAANAVAIGGGDGKSFNDNVERTVASGEKAAAIGYNSSASGKSASALGTKASATAENAAAIGTSASASAKDTLAAGSSAQATAEGATAVGKEAKAQKADATALGSGATASETNATALGKGATASKGDATAVGSGAQATEANAVAVGKGAEASKGNAIAIGKEAEATEASATAIGDGANAEKANAVAIGKGAISGGTSGIAMGNDAQAQAKDTIAVGSSSRASNDNASAFGNAATAAGSGSTAIGYQANTTGANSTAIGAAAQSTKASSTALGNGAKAFGTSAIAIGEGATVGIAEGRTTAGTTPAVDAPNSIAIGKNAKVLAGSGSIALGAGTEITASDVGTSSGAAQKTYPYMLTNTIGTDAVSDKENGIVAIGTKRSSSDTGFARRLTGVAGGVGDYDAVNLKQAKAIESSLKKGERHIKATSYTPNGSGTITLNYVDGENKDVSNETATITDVAKKSVVDGINTTVNTHTTQITNLTSEVGGKVSQSDFNTFKAKAITFTGDDNAGVARTLDTTLTVKGGANYTSTTANTNIRVEKDGSSGAAGLLVKLSDKLTGMKEIAGDGKTDLVIKNGTNKVTITPGKDNDKGTINFGDAKVVASNLEADITYRANGVADTAANTVKLKKGLNFTAATDTTTTTDGPKSGLSITTGGDGLVTFGLDKATRSKVDNAADKNLSNLSDNGKDKVKELAKTAAQDAVKVAPGINTTVTTDTTTTPGVTTYKVNAIDTTVAVGSDALTINDATPNANKVRAYSVDLSTATKGKLAAVGNLATVIGGTTIAADGTVTGPTFNITKADGGTDSVTTLKGAIDKLNATNAGQNTKISETAGKVGTLETNVTNLGNTVTNLGNTVTNLGNTVTNNYNDLSNKITQAGTNVASTLTAKGLDFTGNDTTDTGKVHRDLGTTLTIQGAENFTRGTTDNNNIKVSKNGNTLDVKLAENLGNIKEIAGDGTHDLVIKNGDTKVTVKAPKDGNTGSIDFGNTKLVTNNLEADIAYKAGGESSKKTVKLQTGFTFVAGEGTVAPTTPATGAATTTSPTASTDGKVAKKGIVISTEADGVVNIGLDSDTRSAIDNAANKDLSNLNSAGTNKVSELAKAAAKEAVKVDNGINTTVDTDTTTTPGVTTYKVNAIDTTVAVGSDALTINDATPNTTTKVRAYSLDLSDATKNKLKAIGNLATVIGGTTITADGTVTGPTFNITKADGGTDSVTTLKDAIDKLNATNAGQNTKISETAGKVATLETNVTNLGNTVTNLGNTVTSNYNDLSSKITQAGTNVASTLTSKGLDFTGNDTTDKVHRDLGTVLTIQGAENFMRGSTDHNIKVVKNGDALDVKLAENLGNIKEIAGDGTNDLVIKNGTNTVTITAGKTGDNGTVNFGNAKVVTSNLDADIAYKAGTETSKNKVKLADGFNFVAGTGTVAATTPATGATTPAAGTTTPAADTATTTSPTSSTDDKTAKKGIVISTEANGVVNIGLDSDTRSAIDNAASKSYVENALTNLNSTITGNANLNFAGNVTKDAQGHDANKIGLSLATGTLHIKGDATDITTTAKGDTVTIALTEGTQNKLKAIGNLANVIGGTTIAADGTVTGPTFNITKADGTNENANTLKEAIEKLNATNEGQNTKISETAGKVGTLETNVTNLGNTVTNLGNTVTNLGNTVTSNYNDLSNKISQAGTNVASTLTSKGLDFSGNDTADKVHRDLGTVLTIQGADNFTRGSTDHNIKVVKNGDALDVKLAENLAKIKEISGDGSNDLVIKNGDTKVTVKAPKDGNTGSIDFGDTKLVTKNLEADIAYKAGGETAKKTVKLQTGFTFVAGDGTVAATTPATGATTPAAGATTPAAGTATTTSPTASTDDKTAKKGIVISTENNGVVNIGLDSDTRSAIDNAASKNYVENALTNLNSTITNNANLNFAGNVTKDAQNNDANKIGLSLASGTLNIKGDATDITTTAKGDTVTIALTEGTQNKLKAVGNLANVIGGTTIAADGTVTGPTFSITKADGTNENANTLKEALDKLNSTNVGQNTAITTLGTRITSLVDGGMVFAGDDATADKVTRKLGETLNIHGQNNITVKKDATDATTLNVKLASDLKNITSITNADADNKPGTTISIGGDSVTITNTQAPATGAITGVTKTVTIGKNGVDAGSMKITNVADAEHDNDAANKKYVDTAIRNLNTTITNNANLNFAGNVTKDGQDHDTDKVGLALATGTLHIKGDATDITTTAKGDTVEIALTKALQDKLKQLGDTSADGRDGKSATSTPGASGTAGTSGTGTAGAPGASGTSGAAGTSGTSGTGTAGAPGASGTPGAAGAAGTSGTGTAGAPGASGTPGTTPPASAGSTGLTGADGLNGHTLTDKVNALRNGEAGIVVYTDDKGERLQKGNDGKYYYPTDLKPDGTVKTAAENNGKEPKPVDNPQARIVNSSGDTKIPTTFSNIADGKVEAGSHDAVNGGQLYTVKTDLTNAGLDFYGNEDTRDESKVHRNLGQVLKIKGAGNFERAATATNNINVVKNATGDGFDIQLAENLRDIKEIAGDGSNDLVIKNGDTKVTVKAPKDGDKGSINFGNTKLVTNNLEADIAYKAGGETAKKTVKLQTGFTFVAGDGTVASTTPATGVTTPAAGATTPAAGTATTTSPTASTDDKTAKKGIVISTEANGVVNIGLDKDTRSAIDNAASKSEVNTAITSLSKTISNNSNLRYAGDTNVGAATGEDHLNLALATGTLKVAGTAGEVKTVAQAGTITISLEQAVKDKLAQLSDKNADGRDGKLGSEADAIASTGIAKEDGLNGTTATYKVNALRHGEAGSVVYTDADGNRIVKATDGNYYKATEVNADGVVKTADQNNGITPVAVDKTTIVATLVNTDGTTALAADDINKVATTKLTNIKEAAITATSNDAVTGRQLYGLKSDLATYLGGGSAVDANGTFTGPTYNITKDDGTNGTTPVKSVGDAISNLNTRINNANSSLSTKGLDFYGNKDTVDTDKVHRNLGETLKLKGAENFVRDDKAKNNINVEKNTTGDGFDVKLAENLGNIKEIAGDGKTDLVIKNGDATITLKPATADKTDPDTGVVTPGKTATVDFGNTTLVAKNLETDITYRANGVADTAAHKVKLQKGLNFVAGTGTVAQPAASTTPATGGVTTPATPPATDSETTKSGIMITTGDNGLVTIGLDSDTRNAIDNAANKDLSNLSQTGKDQVTALAKAAAKDVVKVEAGKNTTVTPKQDGDVTKYVVDAYDTKVAVSGTELTISGGELDTNNVRTYTLGLSDDVKNKLTAVTNVGNTSSDGRDGKAANGKDGAAGNAGDKGLTGKDGLNGSTLTDKVNALRNGEAGSVVYTNEAGERLIKANDGNYYKPSEVNTDGSVKTQAENNNVPPTPVANPQARIVNGSGETTTPTTLSNIKDGKIADGSHDAVNGGQLHTVKTELTKAGLDFTGDDTTDKVHRDLGTTLTIKGGENFTRGANENNIKVVKKTDKGVDRLDVQLAENLGNMKGISGNDTDSLVIKNGDATITLTPAKAAETDPATGTTTPAKTATVDFGKSNVVAENLDTDITYRANSVADTAAHKVKLKKGLNFVSATDTDTTTEGPKSGLTITTGDDGLVTFGLDKATRNAIDNVANKDLSNLTTEGKKVITDAAQGAVKVKAGNNVTIDPETKDNVTTYTVNGRDTTVQAATRGSVSVTGGTLSGTGERAYTVDLTETTKTEINKISGINTRLGTAEGNITTLQQAVQGGRVFTADTGVASATVALGETLAIKGGATGTLIDGNIGVELIKANDTSPATMMIRLKKDMDMKDGSTSYVHYMDVNGTSVKAATTKVDGTGVTITPEEGSNKPSVKLTADGLYNGDNPIHNVGVGTKPNDAATVGQVNALAGAVSQRVNNIGAHAAALAAMNPLSYDPLKKSQVMAGYGSYKGSSALALGVAHYANEDTLFNVGVSVGNGENMVNAGVTYRFGGEDSMIPERYKGGPISSVYVMQDEITALKAENARKDVENAKKQAENEEMKAQIKMLIERVTMLEAKK
ncbi:YadA-like family protein [Veillonella sp. VA142]|uniref:YadA-like family protein n=1 Tax=Veillonella sp. VA142 TaxID=741834 RepID=UPI0013DEA1C9|nr:YadA-like family protein [Veillonella sp. VA142]